MRKVYHFVLTAMVGVMSTMATAFAQGPDVLIPVPAEYQLTQGVYCFEGEPAVKIKRVSENKIPAEGYRLEVTKKGVIITASTAAGEFYAR
jgi:N-acetyl-beta-hexosaminidase